MGDSVMHSVRQPRPGLWVVLLRVQQRVGVPGVVGLGLLAAAMCMLAVGWRQHREIQREYATVTTKAGLASSSSAGPARTSARPTPVRWPSATQDIPLLLARIERTAVERGLGWPRADYRFNAATAETPDHLEVRCVLKGPYRSVRGFVTALLLDLPTLTLREFSVSRVNSDAADVEAKLAIVVYLQPGAGTGPGSQR